MTSDDRIAELERRLQEAEERIQRLIETFNGHTHRYIVDREEASCGCCPSTSNYDDTYSPQDKV